MTYTSKSCRLTCSNALKKVAKTRYMKKHISAEEHLAQRRQAISGRTQRALATALATALAKPARSATLAETTTRSAKPARSATPAATAWFPATE